MRTRSSDEDALLRAIWEASADDAPRLVYADWLDEHGDGARAEFIRVQCELARADPAGNRYAELERREAALRKAHRRTWCRGLPSGAHTFRRGFPVNEFPVEVSVRAVRRFPLGDWAKVPALNLHFRGNLSALDALADWPGLERIGCLWLTGPGLTAAGLGRFLGSSRLRNLTALEFEKVKTLGPAALRALADSPVWPRLTRLSIGLCDLSDRAVRALAQMPPAPNLTELRMQEPDLSGGASVLGGARLLSTVRDLDLWATEIGSAGVSAFARNPHLTAMRQLDLSCVGEVSARAAELLAHAPALADLIDLSLGYLSDPDSAIAFVESPTMGRLRKLMVVHWPRAKMSAAVRRKVRARFGPDSVIESAV